MKVDRFEYLDYNSSPLCYVIINDNYLYEYNVYVICL